MSYRKLTIDGQQYEYTVGKKFVKVKGVGTVLIEKVSDHVYCEDDDTWYIHVRPKYIVDYIKLSNHLKK